MRSVKREWEMSVTASRISSFEPKWCCAAPQVMPARSAIRLALADEYPPSLISEIADCRILSRVFFDFQGLTT